MNQSLPLSIAAIIADVASAFGSILYAGGEAAGRRIRREQRRRSRAALVDRERRRFEDSITADLEKL